MRDISFEKSGYFNIPNFDGEATARYHAGRLKKVLSVSVDHARPEVMRKWLSLLAMGTAILGTYGALSWIALQWLTKF